MHKITNTYHLYFLHFVKLLAFIVLVLAIIGVSAAILSMFFGKPIGDDYGAIATFHSGNWLHEAYNSLITTGRYGQSIASSLLYGILGNHIDTLLPLTITMWFIVLTFFYVKSFLRPHIKTQQSLTLYSFAASIILTFLILFINNAPETTNLTTWVSYQLFFWPSGIVTYTLPLLIFLSGLYLLFLSNLRSHLTYRAQTICYIVILFLSSLFNEVQPAVFLIVSFGLFVLSYLKLYGSLRQHRPMFLITITTALIGLVALYFAPGRIERSHVLETVAPSSNGSLIGSIDRNLATLTHGLYLHPRELILLIIIGILAAVATYQVVQDKKIYTTYVRHTSIYVILLPIICLISIITSVALIVLGYGYSAGIYPRTMLIAQITYVITILSLSFSLSSLLLCRFGINNIFRITTIIIGIAFLVSIPKYIDKVQTQVNSSVTYYNAWIEQDNLLRKAATNNIRETIYLQNPATGMGDGFSLQCTGPYAKSTMWLNVQITQYYGNQDRVCPATDRAADQKQSQEWSHS